MGRGGGSCGGRCVPWVHVVETNSTKPYLH